MYQNPLDRDTAIRLHLSSYQEPLIYHAQGDDMSIQKRVLTVLGFLSLLLWLGLHHSYAQTKGAAHIYVADTVNNRIIRFDDMTGKNWVAFGSEGNEVNQFHYPEGLAVDPSGRIYIADVANNRIVRIDDMTGKNWTTLGNKGSAVKQFDSPNGIALDKDGRIYIKDSNNSRIVRMDDMDGKNWTVFDKLGGEDHFHFINGHIFVSADGKIYIGDDANHRIIRMDDMTGKNLVMLGSEGNEAKQFELPYGIFSTPDGKIYVADAGNHYIIQMDDITGKNRNSIGNNTPVSPTPSYTKKQQCYLPFDVFVDGTGKINVAHTTNHRITRMDDITGKNWVTFGAGGSGTNQFKFPRTVIIR